MSHPFNIFQCLLLQSSANLLQEIASLPHRSFLFSTSTSTSFAVNRRIFWDSNTDCSWQGWLLWCWAGPEQSSNLIQFVDGIIELIEPLKILIFCSPVWPQGRALCWTACPFRTKLWASVCIIAGWFELPVGQRFNPAECCNILQDQSNQQF